MIISQQYAEELGRQVDELKAENARLRASRNAIIEECARVADGMAYIELCADDGPGGSVAARPHQKAAAAIRALKDKP